MTEVTPNQGLVLPVNDDLSAVPTHFGLYNSGVENRLVQRFFSAVDRTARRPSPNEGEVSYLADVDAYEWYSGSAWETLYSGSAWTPYTPIWSAISGSPPTIGNGTLSGRYQRVGKTVHYYAQITMGSTTSYSVVQWTLSLPVPALTSTTLRSIAQGRIHDASPASAWSATGWVFNPATPDVLYLEAQGPTETRAMTQGFPITFASGDIVGYSGTYEAM